MVLCCSKVYFQISLCLFKNFKQFKLCKFSLLTSTLILSTSLVVLRMFMPNLSMKTLILQTEIHVVVCSECSPFIQHKNSKFLTNEFKRRGPPMYSWIDWLHTALQHLYMVICKGKRGHNSKHSSTYLAG